MTWSHLVSEVLTTRITREPWPKDERGHLCPVPVVLARWQVEEEEGLRAAYETMDVCQGVVRVGL